MPAVIEVLPAMDSVILLLRPLDPLNGRTLAALGSFVPETLRRNILTSGCAVEICANE